LVRPTRFIALSVLMISIPLVSTGCRSVYVHPEATAEKFERDQIRCKYNMNQAELDRVLSDGTPRVASDGATSGLDRNWLGQPSCRVRTGVGAPTQNPVGAIPCRAIYFRLF
jgi:hypothetical protein